MLLQSTLEPARRLYVVAKEANHNFVYDVMEACWDAFGAPGTFDRDFGRPFPPSTPEKRRAAANAGDVTAADTDDDETHHPLLSPDRMYLIDGPQYVDDTWIQDQMALGYCSAPGGRSFNVALHCKRSRHLRDFVKREMQHPEDGVFVFNGIADQTGEARDPTNSGGNIAVSPPVNTKTTAETTNEAGPSVPAHPPAPHGKMILGDCHNPHRAETMGDHETGTVHEETRTFLQSQRIQPIVPIDTSWLGAGHVDEIMAFVPGADGPKLAMARPDVMETILTEAQQIAVRKGRTHFHRGRHRAHAGYLSLLFSYKRIEQGASNYAAFGAQGRAQMRRTETVLARSYDETSIEDLHWDNHRINQDIHRNILAPIEHRLCHYTGLNRTDDVLPLPVYFRHFARTQLAEAAPPNVVNMQVLNTDPDPHLLVPDPCGPRLPRHEAEAVVRYVLNEHDQTDTRVQLPQEEKDGQKGFQFWAWPFLQLRTLALFFTHKKQKTAGKQVFLREDERTQMIDVIKQKRNFSTLPRDLKKAVYNTEKALHNANPDLVRLVDDKGQLADQWHRLFIPEDTVDVVKAYTQSVLGRAGRTVPFVDDWFYHSVQGDVHCATNVLRTPPATDSPEQPERPPWWQSYPDIATADTAYDPNDTAHTQRTRPRRADS